ncbi:uncharacterized protein BJ212DRAFT_1298985 [Suillus subaureus]|uniref:Uncharacterized protein n=1 Tax=Suillus subaureus TaxID=48587 RepID=A0A9P7JEA3_9AGAM|nr:uncharacterized protein BJ212DRAFT_1298985 [Suillus subaureus]KAG1818151.1 hypothetical protein BJ212DRAFT_1298985 [Suillus subaureus]
MGLMPARRTQVGLAAVGCGDIPLNERKQRYDNPVLKMENKKVLQYISGMESSNPVYLAMLVKWLSFKVERQDEVIGRIVLHLFSLHLREASACEKDTVGDADAALYSRPSWLSSCRCQIEKICKHIVREAKKAGCIRHWRKLFDVQRSHWRIYRIKYVGSKLRPYLFVCVLSTSVQLGSRTIVSVQSALRGVAFVQNVTNDDYK